VEDSTHHEKSCRRTNQAKEGRLTGEKEVVKWKTPPEIAHQEARLFQNSRCHSTRERPMHYP
jgi:hypothetical protein